MASTSLSTNSISPFRSEIFLDKPIYNPGDLVNGQVILELSKKLICDTVNLQLLGSARVFFIQKIVKPGAFLNQAFEQVQNLIDVDQNLWVTMNNNVQKKLSLEEIARRASSTAIHLNGKEKRDNLPGLEQGTHTFNFSFPLSQTGLYTSFDAKNSAGCIRYYLLLKVYNGSMVVMRKKLLFPVVCPKILLNYPLSKADQLISQRKDFEKGAYLSVELLLEKRTFVPGEPVKGCILIENRSGKSVKYACLYIHQETICYSSRPEIQIHESSFDTPAMALTVDKLPTGENIKYPIKFNVPALMPNIDVPNCIQTSYNIQLDVGFIRNSPKAAPIHIKVPISIGTHLQSPGEGFPSAPPPPYEDIENRENVGAFPLTLPPPDYNASILGLSSIENDDQGYQPLCYHYNFGFCLEDEKSADEKKTE